MEQAAPRGMAMSVAGEKRKGETYCAPCLFLRASAFMPGILAGLVEEGEWKIERRRSGDAALAEGRGGKNGKWKNGKGGEVLLGRVGAGGVGFGGEKEWKMEKSQEGGEGKWKGEKRYSGGWARAASASGVL
jgi:hypothetical protein